MIYQYKFDKILTIKEKEKNDARSKYNEAQKVFEQAAEKLYYYLKKKEELIDFQQTKLSSGLSIQEIRHQQLFMGNLEKLIDESQKDVINARNLMNFQQEKLKEKNVEMKKYEKIKEKDFQKFLKDVKETENKQMDEISIQQFISKR